MDWISHIFEIKTWGAQNLTLEFSQISVESVTVNISHFLDVYIWSLFHKYITLLHGCSDASYEISKQRSTLDILNQNMKM